MQKINVGILKPGSAPEKLAAIQGDYDARFRALLGEDAFAFATYDIENGVFPESATAADAWIITGSRHGVYEDHPWIAPLEQLIRDIQVTRRPLVGICFGHQIVAQALGGRVERAAAGWIAGPRRYRSAEGNSFFANAWHRDQVVGLPPEAEIIATGDGCPAAGLRYRRPILTLQAHPEFDTDYFLGLLAERGGALPEGQFETVRDKAHRCTLDLDYLARLLRDMLKAAPAHGAGAANDAESPDL
ncbi:type 1 glutamine amidotransferase [Rhizobium jaguaris]|uniref:Type 1 glutamine amidotransferase n=1 Tax=Rhizobium jaguaris TaxID=1312183 RepID=A0A387FVN2_9HYPH|nr:type 1 glutamine amidotransferase [Rhizobium jaguaris]AYG61847.1 type 1 glutamine amidotransferase [Rhizobium jaguaris]